jgi:hypothetical protein
VAAAHIDTVIAGVNKAGTTSLFVSLSTHPEIVPSAVKETRFFLPARYGQPLEPISVYDDYFRAAPGRRVHLEASPSLFYGGAAVAEVLDAQLSDPHVLLVLREPVARAISFFSYQKIRLRFPVDLSIADYLAAADRLNDDDFSDPENEKYMAFRGGCYADFLPAWLDTFGPDRLRIIWFDDLFTDEATVLRNVATFLGIDPSAFPREELSSENRTTSYKNARAQQFALAVHDRFERLFRRHPDMKRKIRSLYYRVNGRPTDDAVPPRVHDELTARYREPNARLAAQLEAAGIPLAPWLSDAATASDRA